MEVHGSFLQSVYHHYHIFHVLLSAMKRYRVGYTKGAQGLEVATDTEWMEQGLEMLLRKVRGIAG